MQDIERWVFPDTPVNVILALRPIALGIFEKYGIDPFTASTARIGDICKEKGIPWDSFLVEMRVLEIPDRNSEWTLLPLYYLLDYLTQEHREFIRDFLPDIKKILSAEENGGECLERLQALIREWPAFAEAFHQHIESEESFLFLKILRYDYCVRHGKIDPDFFEGSVSVFAALQLHKDEQCLMDVIRNFLETSAASIPVIGDGDVAGLKIVRLLQAFESKHKDHSRIERDVLVPLASALEKKLYDRSISGEGHPPLNPSVVAHVSRAHETL